ncbi:MAG: PhnD/SsuA/transferrin family substrate-binding protein [Pseudomonadota bacterium]
MEHMIFMVCPHDTAKDPDKWFHFALYLSQNFHISTKYYPCIDFVEFHEKMMDADIIYANPQDSLILVEEFNYIPLVHSSNLYDEIVFIANSDVKHESIQDINSQECISCNSMMVTRVGIKCLDEKQVQPSKIHNKNGWLPVVTSVYKGEAPYGFVYKDFYDGLNNLSKSLVIKLGETDGKKIYHSILINQKHKDKINGIIEILTQAHLTKNGENILARVNIEKFIATTRGEISQFKSLLATGSELMEL